MLASRLLQLGLFELLDFVKGIQPQIAKGIEFPLCAVLALEVCTRVVGVRVAFGMTLVSYVSF